MKKKKAFLLFLIVLTFLLSSCGNKGKLNEGTCKGRIYFSDIPKEFGMMDEHVQELVEISVELTNLTTEKEYHITLNVKNGFKQEVMLHPGTYRVTSVYASGKNASGITVVSDKETAEFKRDQETLIPIVLKDAEYFSNHWKDSQPQPDIRVANMYSGMIQINRKVIPMTDLLSEMDTDTSVMVNPYDKATVYDSAKGLSVTVENDNGEQQPASACKVISVTASDGCIVFPEGVSVATAPEAICNQKTGLYGEPSKITGMLLFGWELDGTQAVYQDSDSGNRITVYFSQDTSYVSSIKYELGVFE